MTLRPGRGRGAAEPLAAVDIAPPLLLVAVRLNGEVRERPLGSRGREAALLSRA